MTSFKKIDIICDGTLCGKNYDTVPAELIGKGLELVVLVGEAPFRDEVAKQRPFIGRAGMILRGYLDVNNFQYLIINSIMCKPYDTAKSKPTDVLIKACTPVRDDLLKIVEEGDTIVCFGRYAQTAMFGKHVAFSETPYFIKHPIKGFDIPTWACYHPMAPIYDRSKKEIFEDILRASGKFKI